LAPPAFRIRLTAGRAKVVVVYSDQRAKLAPGDDRPAEPAWLTVVAGDTGDEGALSFWGRRAGENGDEPQGRAGAVGGDGPVVQLFTSGTTGTPKGVPVPVKALASFQ
ncbi:AMP-dependent synthetase, partial [Streptomyces viridochromogenes]|uniref:AMP-binding protein n=1 Tax=Streptomyces viridochromogenes TaxID=1938 RepID=UPI0006C592D6